MADLATAPAATPQAVPVVPLIPAAEAVTGDSWNNLAISSPNSQESSKFEPKAKGTEGSIEILQHLVELGKKAKLWPKEVSIAAATGFGRATLSLGNGHQESFVITGERGPANAREALNKLARNGSAAAPASPLAAAQGPAIARPAAHVKSESAASPLSSAPTQSAAPAAGQKAPQIRISIPGRQTAQPAAPVEVPEELKKTQPITVPSPKPMEPRAVTPLAPIGDSTVPTVQPAGNAPHNGQFSLADGDTFISSESGSVRVIRFREQLGKTVVDVFKNGELNVQGATPEAVAAGLREALAAGLITRK